MKRTALASFFGLVVIWLGVLWFVFRGSADEPVHADANEVAGKHVGVIVPPTEKALGKRIAEQADLAIERCAADLGVAVPNHRFRVYLYATAAEYETAEFARTKGQYKANLAFTYAPDAEVHMVIQPRAARAGISDGPGMLEALVMHELSHALQYKVVKTYDEQPAWLSEGFADLQSERAVGRSERGCADKTPWFADFIHDVKDALQDGRYIPLEKLIEEPLQGRDSRDRNVRYGEAFALARWLDSADDPARRASYRKFLKEVNAMPAASSHDEFRKQVNAKFREQFGKPVPGHEPSLVPLEQEFVRAVKKMQPFPWQVSARELRTSPDGALVLESFPGKPAYALATTGAAPISASIKATATIADVGGRQADIIFCHRGSDDYWKLAFTSQGAVALWRKEGTKWTNLATAKVAPEVLAIDKPHQLEVIVDVSRIFARVNGQLLFRYTLSDKTFGTGRWGIGAHDGRVTYTGVSETPFEPK